MGFWTAYQCHLIATHPARNLSLCHILGAFVRNNIIITEAEDLSPMYMVDAPGLFDIPFFVRTNLVYYREGVPQFYLMGEAPGGRAQQGQEGQAGQIDQAQRLRQENLEKTVIELADENRQSRAEMTKKADNPNGEYPKGIGERKGKHWSWNKWTWRTERGNHRT